MKKSGDSHFNGQEIKMKKANVFFKTYDLANASTVVRTSHHALIQNLRSLLIV